MYRDITKTIALIVALGIVGCGQTTRLTVAARVLHQHYCRVQISTEINMFIDLKMSIANRGNTPIRIDDLYDPFSIWFGRSLSDLQSEKYEMHFQQDPVVVQGTEPMHASGATLQPGESIDSTKVLEVPIRGTPFGELSDGDHNMRMVSGMLLLYENRYLSQQAEVGPLLVNINVPAQLPSCAAGG